MTGTYIINRQAFTDTEDVAGNQYACARTQYDGQVYATGQSAGLTRGLVTARTLYTACGATPSGAVTTSYTYDGHGSRLTTTDPDANAGNAAHVGCTVGTSTYSTCTTYDGTFAVLPTATSNALNQTTTTGYSPTGASALADSSGNLNQAALSGGVIPGVLGPVSGDTAMAFDGSSGYALAPASATLNVAGAMTIEAWVSRGSATGPISSGIAGKCVDAAYNGTANGTHVQLYDCNGTAAQNWTPMADGTIRDQGKCLDISGMGTTNGTLVQLWDCWGGANQVWKAGPNNSLVNPVSGRCLDDPGATTVNGTQLQIYDCNGTAAQSWTPLGAGPIAEYNSGSAWGAHFWNWPNPSQLYINFSDTSGIAHTVTAPTGLLQMGQWAHVVATYDGLYGTLYVNGAQVAQANLGSFTPQTTYPLNIGRRPSGSPAYYFAGAIGQAAVYKGALSPARVAAHYSAATTVPAYTSAVKADAPVAYYRMNDGGGAVTGFGLWPVSSTDANGQAASYTYDALGRPTSVTAPGEPSGLTTNGTAYTAWCAGTSAQSPCLEIDKTQRLNATTTVSSRGFYDGLGHLVETRTPALAGDIVRYSSYDVMGRLVFQSVPYLVSAYTGGAGPSAFSIPDTSQAGASYTYDGLGRQTSATDALSNKTTTARSVVCGAAATGDPACYEQALVVDPKGHQRGTLADALGRTTYGQLYTGSSSAAYAVYATTKYTYDYLGDLAQVLHPDGATKTSYTYDPLGRKTGMTDPDRGTETYAYDADSNLVQSVDGRGAAGTVFVGYDGLNREIWRNTTNSATGAYDTYSYDSTAGGNLGVGRLTGESFSAGALSGTYAYVYDGRGRQTSSTLTLAGLGQGLGAPTAITATAGNAQATVSWSAPASNGGSAITGYTVTASPGGQTATAAGSATSATVTGLANGTAYTFTVTASNALGTGPASAASNQVTPATVPGVPGAVTATAGNSQATVSWAAPASNGGSAIMSYTVTASPGGGTVTVAGSSTSAVLGGLTNGTPYTFTVAASNAMGAGAASAASNAVTPSGTAAPRVDQRIGLTHANNVTSLTSAPFAVKPQAGDLIVVQIWDWNASNFNVSSVTDAAGNPYVRAVQSPVNNGVQAEVWYAKNAAVASGNWTVSVNTTASAADMEFAVVALSGMDAASPLDATQSGVSASPGTSGSLSVASSVSGDYVVGAMTTDASNSNLDLTTAAPWQQEAMEPDNLNFQAGQAADLTSFPAAGTQTWSFSWTVPAGNWAGAVAGFKAASVTNPGAPTGVSATGGNGQATVSWSAPASNGGSPINSYTVTASPGGQSSTVNGGTTSATVLGLPNGSPYTFTVKATNAAGSGPASAASNSVTPASVPGSPTGLTAVAGNGQATVSWSAPASNGGSAITGYTVTASPGGQTASINSSRTSATLSGLANGTAYTFTVAATNAVGTSQASAVSNSVTPTAPPIYQVQTTYDDAGHILTQTYPTGETVSNSYTAQGWLSGVTTKQGSTTTNLLSNAAYSGIGGAFGEMTTATMGGTTFSASYDLLDRATDLNVKRNSDSATIFDQARTFDAAGNISTINTTLPTGTDNQAFCYDEQDRLTWAGSAGVPPCTGTAITAGSLSAAQYSQSFTYDNMGRLKSGPLGNYTYGDPAHVHAATSTSGGYTATYDAAGGMTCRAPTTTSTCAGPPTGAQLGYNNEGEMAGWQNQPASPSSAVAYLYDGQGERVAQQVTQGVSTTTTVYVGDVEEVSTTGSTTTTTTYYYANGKRIALGVNGQISYVASDALGSVTLAFGSSGTATASQLFAPYGGVRYSNGIMPTSFGFTGQRGDSVSGLSYFHARYLDPLLGQFASADKLLQGDGLDILGLSRYAYVEGNPIAMTDPTGHDACIDDGMGNCVFPDPTGGGGGGDSTDGGGGGGGCDVLPDCLPDGGGGGGDTGGGSGGTGGGGCDVLPDCLGGGDGGGGGSSGGGGGSSGGGGNGSGDSDPLQQDACAQNPIQCPPRVAPQLNLDLLDECFATGLGAACVGAAQDWLDQFENNLNNPLGRLWHMMGGGDSAAGSAERSVAEDAAAAEAATARKANSLRRLIEEHEAKLQEYRANPLDYDNRGILARAIAMGKHAAEIYEGRIRSLQKQIDLFRKQLEDLGV